MGQGAPRPPREEASARGSVPLALEGLFQSLAQGLGETYLSALALRLAGGPAVLGLVATLPTAATALAQAMANRFRGRMRGARAFIATAWSGQAAGLAALGLCVFLPTPAAAWALCAVAFFAWGLGGLAVPAWTALVGASIPRSQMGRFFGLRGAFQQTGIVVAILAGGLTLSHLRSLGAERAGFILLFLTAGLLRAAGSALMIGVPPPPSTREPAPADSGLDLLRRSAKFRRLAVYLWGLHFATHVATPFFVPYMLDDLRLSYAQVGLLLAVPAVVKALTLGRWGTAADRIGPGPLLRLAGWLVIPVSALWLVSGNPWWILIAQVYAGLAWGAFELAQASALVATTGGRERGIAFFGVVDGAVMIGGALLGAVLVRLFDSVGARGYLFTIGCSSVLRALPAVILLWRVRGIGRPRWSHRRMPLRVWAIRPSRGASLRPWGDLAAGPDPEGTGQGRGRGASDGESSVLQQRKPRW